MAIIATPGASNANSYVTLDEFNTYLTNRPNSATLLAKTDPEKEAALITAATLLDARVCFVGTSTNADQSRRHPIMGLISRNGYLIDNDTVATDIKNAQMEWAALLLAKPSIIAELDQLVEGIERVKASSIDIKFRDDFKSVPIPSSVAFMIPTAWLCPDDNNFLFDVWPTSATEHSV